MQCALHVHTCEVFHMESSFSQPEGARTAIGKAGVIAVKRGHSVPHEGPAPNTASVGRRGSETSEDSSHAACRNPITAFNQDNTERLRSCRGLRFVTGLRPYGARPEQGETDSRSQNSALPDQRS